jgi:hypothetical protein
MEYPNEKPNKIKFGNHSGNLFGHDSGSKNIFGPDSGNYNVSCLIILPKIIFCQVLEFGFDGILLKFQLFFAW